MFMGAKDNGVIMTPWRSFRATLAIAILFSVTVTGAMGLPTVTTTFPANDQVLLSRTVNVTGTAAGSDDSWTQTTGADFSAGSTSGVLVNSTGKLTLGRTVYDDFNDNSLDAARWTLTPGSGISTTEENEKLRQGGTSTVMGWTYVAARSNGFVSNDTEARLLSLSGSGNSWATSLGLWQDGQNSINIGAHYDWTWSYIKLSCSYALGGAPGEVTLGNLGNNPAPHTFRIRYSSGTVYMYMDGNQAYTMNMNLQNPLIQIATSAVDKSRVDAAWDDVTYPTPDGNFTSRTYDSRSTYPLLTNVAWNSSAPAGTKVSVSIRSGDASDLSDASSWSPVSSGQSSGLPAVKRYLQYRVRLEWTDGLVPPELRDITFSYHKPVAKVEVSVDQQSWLQATGTTSWQASLQVPEDAAFIYSRVTDAAGDTAMRMVRIRVDTTPPVGTILINNGDWATLSPVVSVALNATDRFGIAKMMVSERSDFSGSAWGAYRSNLEWTLSAGDGEKTVYARFQDANGWESDMASDTIMLDTTPPAGSIIINDNASRTNRTAARLTINASDLLGVTEMKVSRNPNFAGTDWTPFNRSMDWTLQSGSGERTVYAMFRNPMGQESAVASDSILLDTEAPSAVLSINNGAPYTNSRLVNARLNATDNTIVASLEIAEDPALAAATLQPYQPDISWTLSPSEGGHTIYARVWDDFLNPGPIVSASITLDLTAPAANIEVPAMVDDYIINVNRGSSDILSGLAYYEIEYRDGSGNWIPWVHVIAGNTSAPSTFSGQDGRTYSFRMRAMDNAGNIGQFVEANNTATVNIPAPAVTITEPFTGATARGALRVKGTAHSGTGPTLRQVQIRIDNGSWETANGTYGWTYEMNTRSLKNGPHTITARSYDGSKYSDEAARSFVVKNPRAEPSVSLENNLPLFLIMAVMLACAGIGIAYLAGRKSRGPPG